MIPQKQNNGESSSSHQPPSAASPFEGMGLSMSMGLGLDISDTFARASHASFADDDEDDDDEIEEHEEDGASDDGDEGGWEDDIRDDRKSDEGKPIGNGNAKAPAQKPDDRTPEQRRESDHKLAAAEKAREAISDAALAAKGITWRADLFYNDESDVIPIRASAFNPRKGNLRTLRRRHDFFRDMANIPEIFMEIATYLKIKDLMSLYAISIDFNETLNGHMSHCMRRCAEVMAPEAAKLYLWRFYGDLCIVDPAGRKQGNSQDQVKVVPSLKWLQMVVHREKTVRDILACMARQGHRMPKGMAMSLKKMWLLMDISTTAARIHMMHNIQFFTNMDLYNMQFFVVKLDMRFNDPIDGPSDDGLRKLFLGQRGLTPLCKLLKRTAFKDPLDVVRLGIRYAYQTRPEHRGMEVYGVPADEIGIMHTEGWGAGRVHLMRPDELMMVESVRRQLGLKNHIMHMMLWGYVNPITGENIRPTEEEVYMSDDEVKPKAPWWVQYVMQYREGPDGDLYKKRQAGLNKMEPQGGVEKKNGGMMPAGGERGGRKGEKSDSDSEDDDDEDDGDEGNFFFGRGTN